MTAPTLSTTKDRVMDLVREIQFFEGILVHEHQPLSVIVDGDRAAINWLFDFTGADDVRDRLDQVALQTWEDRRIVRERMCMIPDH